MSKWDYIDIVRGDYKEDPYGRRLIALMDEYDAYNLMELTLEQVKEYCENKKLI